MDCFLKGIISCLNDESLKQTDVCNNLVLLNELGRRFKDHKHFSCYLSTDLQTKKIIMSTSVSNSSNKLRLI